MSKFKYLKAITNKNDDLLAIIKNNIKHNIIIASLYDGKIILSLAPDKIYNIYQNASNIIGINIIRDKVTGKYCDCDCEEDSTNGYVFVKNKSDFPFEISDPQLQGLDNIIPLGANTSTAIPDNLENNNCDNLQNLGAIRYIYIATPINFPTGVFAKFDSFNNSTLKENESYTISSAAGNDGRLSYTYSLNHENSIPRFEINSNDHRYLEPINANPRFIIKNVIVSLSNVTRIQDNSRVYITFGTTSRNQPVIYNKYSYIFNDVNLVVTSNSNLYAGISGTISGTAILFDSPDSPPYYSLYSVRLEYE